MHDSEDQTRHLSMKDIAEIMKNPRRKSKSKGGKTRKLTQYNLFVRKAHTFPEVIALPANKKMKRIGELWRMRKSQMLKGETPVKSLVTNAAETRQAEENLLKQQKPLDRSRLDEARRRTKSFLEESKMFPIQETEGVTQEEREMADQGGTAGDCAKSTARFPGEKHAIRIEYGKQGKLLSSCYYSFLGPGTNVAERISRGDEPINDLDFAAMKHDLEYLRLMEKLNRGGTVTKKEVRDVDNAFVNRIQESKDDPKMRSVVLGLFRAKYAAEDRGVLDYLKFVRGGGT